MLTRFLKATFLFSSALFLLLLLAQPASAALQSPLEPAGALGPFKKANPTNGATNIPTTLTLSWGSSRNATSYEYCYSTTPNCNSPAVWHNVGAQMSVNVTGLQAGTTYYWQVRSRNATGTRLADSAWWSFSTRPLCYSVTTSVTLAGSGSVDIDPAPNCSWDATLYRAGTQVTLTADPATGYAFTGWSGSVTGTSNPKTTTVNSNKTVTATFALLPGAFIKSGPLNLAVLQTSSVTLNWVSSPNATSYQYCYDTTDNGTCDSGWVSAGANTSANLSGLSLETTYYWQVRARNAAGQLQADNDQWWSFKTQIAPPALFEKVGPANSATNVLTDVTLSWKSSARAAHYEYCYYSTDIHACDGAWSNAGSDTFAFLTGMSLNTTYYWQVRACNTTSCTDADTGAWWSFTPQFPVFQDTSPSVQYSGWSGVVDANAIRGGYRTSQVANDQVTVKLKGKIITLYTKTGPDQGEAQILVDGVATKTFDLYSPLAQLNVTRTVTAPNYLTHTVSIKVLGQKNVLSSGSSVSVDAIRVGATLADSAGLGVKYNSWAGKFAAQASGGSYRASSTKNAIVSMQFTGSSVDWITALGPNFGQARVLIDGKVVDTVDLYSATPQWQVVKHYAGFDMGPHRIQIRVLGTKRYVSTGYQVVVDGLSGEISSAGTTER